MSTSGERGISEGPVLNGALAALCGVLFLTFLDTTIVSVALADVQSSLHAGVTQLQWVVNGYAVAFAALMLAAGSLSDRLGRKRLMVSGLAVFCAGSLIGALAPTPAVLIAARVVMGIGAAASEPGTLSIIRHLYPDRARRARALGTWAATSGLALALGPVFGGLLVGEWSWRAVLWFNVVAGLTALAMTARYVPESKDPTAARLDRVGCVLVSLAVAALAFAVILGESSGYASAPVISLFVVGAVAVVGFVIAERLAIEPVLNLAYLKVPMFSGALAVAFALFFSIFSIFFFAALYLQVVVGYSGYRTALEFLPMAAGLVVASLLAGALVARFGSRLPMALGTAIAGLGILASDAVLTAPATPSVWLVGSLALSGLGFGLSVVPVTAVSLSVIPPEHSGMAASATNTSRELGAVFGVAVLGALVNANLTADLSARLHALGIPSAFQAIVVGAIETGGVPSGGAPGAVSAYGPIVNKVIHAAYGAFRAGLDVSLLTSGALLLAASVVALLTLPGRRRIVATLEIS